MFYLEKKKDINYNDLIVKLVNEKYFNKEK